MVIAPEIRTLMGDDWLPNIYRTKVRLQRTRSYQLDVPQRENSADIQYTLLGLDLKVGKRRFSCPDLATARYIRVFARAGCANFAVPYDITKISPIADELETSWQTMLLLVEDRIRGRSLRSRNRVRNEVIKVLREEIDEIGPGEIMPDFDRPTRQRNL